MRGGTLPCFLANRGSSGYGKACQEAAKVEFAGKTHTDLLGGVDYLVQQSITAPSKVATMGGSYGGYGGLCSVSQCRTQPGPLD